MCKYENMCGRETEWIIHLLIHVLCFSLVAPYLFLFDSF